MPSIGKKTVYFMGFFPIFLSSVTDIIRGFLFGLVFCFVLFGVLLFFLGYPEI